MEADRGIGLRNVYRRLVLLYGERCRFCVESTEGQGTRVAMILPTEGEEVGE